MSKSRFQKRQKIQEDQDSVRVAVYEAVRDMAYNRDTDPILDKSQIEDFAEYLWARL